MDSGSAPMNTGAPEGNRVDAAEFFGCQAITPETASTSHYFFQQSHNFALDDPKVTEGLRDAVLAGFKEDLDMITAQQRMLDLDPDFKMLGLRMDTALGHFRLLVEKTLAEEARSTAGSTASGAATQASGAASAA
jgi:vanillate O-demethylase monooxygenase subunit